MTASRSTFRIYATSVHDLGGAVSSQLIPFHHTQILLAFILPPGTTAVTRTAGTQAEAPTGTGRAANVALDEGEGLNHCLCSESLLGRGYRGFVALETLGSNGP